MSPSSTVVNQPNAAPTAELAFPLPDLSASLPGRFTAAQLTAFFVGLGVVLRLSRYLLNFPLSPDEYQLAANFLDRGFLELLQPLSHNQVAPVGFLWIELAVVRLLGFSEMSLRLFPALCGIASVFLFRRVAGWLLHGVPLLFAVAIFAVAYYPVRYSAEVKPYGSDAFLSLLLFSLTIKWWNAPGETRWLWCLAGLAPLALSLSFTTAFVAAGLSLGIAYSLLMNRRFPESHRAAIAWLAFNIVVAVAFLGLMRLNISAQYETTRSAMTACWADGFPPWRQPLGLLVWLILAHTSVMFAYPVGAEHGGSAFTSLCFAVAFVAAARHSKREVAVTIAGWFGVSLVAAALHRYPYGGHARLSQYLAPTICLMAGAGAALLLARLRNQKLQTTGVRVTLVLCALLGAGMLIREVIKPYQSKIDRDHRDFARRFWNEAPQELTVCLDADLGLKPYSGSLDTA